MDSSIEYGLLLKSHSPERARELISQRYSILGEQKPILVLHEQPSGNKDNASETITKKSKRKSKINSNLKKLLTTKNPRFDQYTPLRALWSAYISGLFDPKDTSLTKASKMLTADWHGAMIEVVSAKSYGFVGKRGILLWESKNQILIILETNRFLQVPKKGCVFKLIDYDLLLIGDRLLCRSSERTTRKFKPHDVAAISDLL